MDILIEYAWMQQDTELQRQLISIISKYRNMMELLTVHSDEAHDCFQYYIDNFLGGGLECLV